MVAAIAVFGASVVLIANVVSTSSARVAATTSSDGVLGAASVSLAQPGDVVELLLDADGLYPGVSVDGCVVVEYTGTVPVSVRLHGAAADDAGLDPYVEIVFSELDGDDCAASDGTPGAGSTELYSGRLDAFWRRHGSYGSGLDVGPTLVSGERIAVVAVAAIIDDNRAQGLTTDFTLTIEARPA